MRYENNICDGCKKEFSSTDDVVVCPVCGTPQHRECFEKNGECVNAALHESGFVWKGNVKTPETEEKRKKSEASFEEPLVCPTCGHENPPGSTFCETCGQKFTFFGVNLLEKELELAKQEEEERKKAEGHLPPFGDENAQSFEEPEEPESDIERMLNARARLVAPGLSKAQEQEVLCGHPIKRVLVFISSNPLRYVNKFRKTEATGKSTWNWAAFFFTPYWFFYRKLYKTGMIFLAVRFVLSLISIPFSTKAIEAMNAFESAAASATSSDALQAALQALLSNAAPLYAISAALLLTSIIAAAIADKIYKRYVTQKLTEAESITDTMEFSQFFLRSSSVNVFAAVLSFAVGYFLPAAIGQLLI